MKNTDCNKDEGIITAINGNSISLHIAQKSECNGCSAAFLCEKSGKTGKDLTVTQSDAKDFSVGEKVSVLVPQNKVLKAIGLAFFYPSVLVILFCVLQYHFFPLNEGLTALISLAILCLYFFILYCNRHKPLFNFSIFIEKL